MDMVYGLKSLMFKSLFSFMKFFSLFIFFVAYIITGLNLRIWKLIIFVIIKNKQICFTVKMCWSIYIFMISVSYVVNYYFFSLQQKFVELYKDASDLNLIWSKYMFVDLQQRKDEVAYQKKIKNTLDLIK